MRPRSLAPDLYNALDARLTVQKRVMTPRERAIAEAKAKADAEREHARLVLAAKAEAKAKADEARKIAAKELAAVQAARARAVEEAKRKAKEEREERRDNRPSPDGATPVQAGGAEAATESKIKPIHVGLALALAAAVYYVWRRRSS